jgi:FMN phosphatase YigB (HAD superfamily)
MQQIYLFDWGDTLMVDFPDMQGKMCHWEQIEAVEGAQEALSYLSQHSQIYIATGADDSSEDDIKIAFERVGLDIYISGYFCKANLGLSKGSAEFYSSIIEKLNVTPNQATMVGDNIEKDIKPALEAGLGAIWFNPTFKNHQTDKSFKQINKLKELCIFSCIYPTNTPRL